MYLLVPDNDECPRPRWLATWEQGWWQGVPSSADVDRVHGRPEMIWMKRCGIYFVLSVFVYTTHTWP